MYIKNFISTLLFTVLIIWGCLMRNISLFDDGPLFPYDDKVYHFILYFILSLLMLNGIVKSYGQKTLMKFDTKMAVIIYGSILGILIEIVQYFTNYRSADIYDFIADVLGSIGAILLYPYLMRIKVLAAIFRKI